MEFEKVIKKPLEVSAIHLNKDNYADVVKFLKELNYNIELRYEEPFVVLDTIPYLIIPSMEGYMRADIGDWIIRGINGELYPCKSEIFEKTYRRAEETINEDENNPWENVQNFGLYMMQHIPLLTKFLMDIGEVSVNVIVEKDNVSFSVYPCPYPISNNEEN